MMMPDFDLCSWAESRVKLGTESETGRFREICTVSIAFQDQHEPVIGLSKLVGIGVSRTSEKR